MFFNGIVKCQFINAIWFTVIITNRNEISVKHIGDILWSRKNTIFLFRNYLVSAPIGILIREKWLHCLKKFLIPILRITSQLKIGFNRLLVQFYDFVSKLHIHRSVLLIAPISEMFPPPYIALINSLAQFAIHVWYLVTRNKLRFQGSMLIHNRH